MSSKRKDQEVEATTFPELVPELDTAVNTNVLTLPTVNAKAKKQTVKSEGELLASSTKGLTENEKIRLIGLLREGVNVLTNQNEMLNHNCQSAYERIRLVEEQFTNYKIKAQTKLQFAKQAVSTCNASIILAGTIEE